jgi:hypothetical protein
VAVTFVVLAFRLLDEDYPGDFWNCFIGRDLSHPAGMEPSSTPTSHVGTNLIELASAFSYANTVGVYVNSNFRDLNITVNMNVSVTICRNLQQAGPHILVGVFYILVKPNSCALIN